MDDFKSLIETALKSNGPLNIDVSQYLKAGVIYSESPMATEFTEGKKLREGFRIDLLHRLLEKSKNKELQPEDILKAARDYNLEIWVDYEKNNGTIDTTLKSFFSFEVAHALKDSANFNVSGLHEKLLVSTQILYRK